MQVNALGTNFMDFPEFHEAAGTSDPEVRAAYEAQIPMRRFGTMEEFASFSMAFLDGTSGFTTGQFVAYAGGWACAPHPEGRSGGVAGAQQVAVSREPGARRHGRGEEVEQHVDEPVRRLDVGEVPDALDDLEPAPRHRLVGAVARARRG